MMRAGECGNCGVVSELCVAGVWEPQGECLDQGTCAPGSIESRPLPLCGEEQRLCLNDCEWSDWSVTTVPAGECNPGDARMEQVDCPDGLYRHQTCLETCTWMTEADPCVDLCGEVPPAPAFADEEEVCIPAGEFVRGAPGIAEPVTTVMVSAFYIDRHVVTNRRYAQCYAAGVCALPFDPWASAEVTSPAFADYWVRGVTWDDAVAFCTWDGGRLLTEAELEKAARGPAPRTNAYPAWETTWDCAALAADWCPGADYTTPPHSDPYDVLLPDVSYYGVNGMSTGGRQWAHDWYATDYYSDPSSLIDPQGPTTGTARMTRGTTRKEDAMGTFAHVSGRRHTFSTTTSSIRCGRDAAGL
jgi:formylglycine-generating enzyme required for sulfatase activity